RQCGGAMRTIQQDPTTSLTPVLPVATQMAEAVRLREPGLRGRALRERIVDALASVESRDPARVADTYPHELSGGMG
ncbi:ABC transporter ATP-binding protein, partial [Burkholderia pseudomallei]